MSQEYIEIRGARENNLKNVSLRIPKRKITIFTGVSGSGKSSIVFDTLATEAQRQMNENFSMFIRTFLPRYPAPDADAIENLSMPIVVDQKRLGGGWLFCAITAKPSRPWISSPFLRSPLVSSIASSLSVMTAGASYPSMSHAIRPASGLCSSCEKRFPISPLPGSHLRSRCEIRGWKFPRYSPGYWACWLIAGC